MKKELMHSDLEGATFSLFVQPLLLDLFVTYIYFILHIFEFCVTNDFKFRGRNFLKGVDYDDPSLLFTVISFPLV